jgi:hypothetical protein
MIILPFNLTAATIVQLSDEFGLFSTVGGKRLKAKFTLEQATKAQRGSRGIALLFP